MRLGVYIRSFRLRTLPLSMAGIVLGSGLAARSGVFSWPVFVLALLTTLSLQILSNLSNELGDALKGTDQDQHGRAAYGMQSGQITEREMRGLIGVFIGLCIVFGTALVWTAFATLLCVEAIVFLLLGLMAIIGAMTYTLGRHSYGYRGLGDLGVFLFFGLLSTIGGYYLQAHTVTWEAAWMGVAIGLPCVGVLNLNNIRDMHNDRLHGKRTFASLLGQTGGRVYHTILTVACLLLMVVYGHYWTLCVVPVWAWHLWYVWTHSERLDRQMPVLMLSTFLVALLALL